MSKRFLTILRLSFLLTCLPFARLIAANESYMQSLTGHLKKGDSLTVIDDKFLNLPLSDWNRLKHLAVEDVVSFELRQDTSLDFYSRSFSCTLNVTIKYFTSRDQQTPTQIDNIDLVVKYDTARGKSYPVIARYRFKDAFKVTVVINSISSPEWKDQLPDVFRLKGQILVNRKYPFDAEKNGKLHLGIVDPLLPTESLVASGPSAPPVPVIGVLQIVNGVLPVSWNAGDFGGAEAYDIEWTYIDGLSGRGLFIAQNNPPSGPFNIDPNLEKVWMAHDATRVTVTSSPYKINVPYPDGYILVRIRQVVTDATTGVRTTGSWVYSDDNNNTAVAQIPTACNAKLNLQYTASFAEEGKHKEVISYYDGTQRNRQVVTLSNSDTYKAPNGDNLPVAVVQESIYDIMGRATVNMLPAPTRNSALSYYRSFNLDKFNNPYNYSDIGTTNCTIAANATSALAGASMYYSPSNTFFNQATHLADYYYTKYVPDAKNFPFSVTQYTADNTGRIRRQGGVGQTLQSGAGFDTKYYYAKPTATELERLFGMEAGNASHYVKNMVVDPNGQASVSYIDANGKTVATALAGKIPDKMDGLPGAAAAVTSINELLIKPADFSPNTTGLSMTASSTFLAEVSGNFTIRYSINPLALVTQYAGTNQLCNNCYYSVLVKVTDECGTAVNSASTSPFQLNDYTCHVNPQPLTQDLTLPGLSIGEYTVSYTLQLSNAAINAQTDYYVQTNTDLQKLSDFFSTELDNVDFTGCYNTCDACKTLGNSVDQFRTNVLALLGTDYFSGLDLTNASISNMINGKISTIWQNLKQHCSTVTCTVSSPCEEKLQQLKADVTPGGQYALYDEAGLNNGNTTNLFQDPATNVLFKYTTAPEIASMTFTADDGTVRTVGSLNQAELIRAYLAHPEWADEFVIYHVEYCSYLWCKDGTHAGSTTNNEASYTFDASLQELYQSGSDAVNKGYYNHADPLALLKVDPWFQGPYGSGHYTEMQTDLQNLSDVLSMTPKINGTSLGVKDILLLVDWMLYCRPMDNNVTQAQATASWQSCSPNDVCRSVTMEWQLYRNYYLQLKSKYYRIEKLKANPACLDCFIGGDPLAGTSLAACAAASSIPQPTVTCPPANAVTLQGVTTGFSDATSGSTSTDYFLNYPAGANLAPVSVDIWVSQSSLDPATQQPGAGSSSYFTTMTVNPGDHIYVATGNVDYQLNNTMAGTYDFYNQVLYFINSSSCVAPPPPSPPPPASTCTSNSNYAAYQNKTRVFNDYTDMQDYNSCNASSGGSSTQQQQEAQATTANLNQALANLNDVATAWKNLLAEVISEEFSGAGLPSNVAQTLSDAMKQLSATYLQIASQQGQPLVISSTLPSPLPAGFTAPNGYMSFDDIFRAVVGNTMMQQGLSPDVVDNAYPYDRQPVSVDDNVFQLTPDIYNYVKTNLQNFQSQYQGAGSPGTFGAWLKQQLGDDYLLTDDQLADLQTRLANNCPNPYLANPAILPVSFTVDPARAKISCQDLINLQSAFNSSHSIPLGSKLYQTVFTNSLNHQLGFAASYSEYMLQINACTGVTQYLYNKPKTISTLNDYFSCSADLLKRAYATAGEEYDQYITQVRITFRNAYISKCLSNTASANLLGSKQEYHYTLYYYDQSGSLVKTIPPEGVRLLTDDQIAQVEQFPAQDPSTCPVFTNVVTDPTTIFNEMSTVLQGTNQQSIEMWLYSSDGTSTRQMRIVTPDNRYMYQAAISGGYVWVELYSLLPDGNGGISITLTNSAVGILPGQVALQAWTHMVVQSVGGISAGALQVYVDGSPLSLLTGPTAPDYPFAWGIDEGVLPTADVSVLKHIRFYNRVETDAEVLADYKNSCLAPVGNLAGSPLLLWGRFNVPGICTGNLDQTTAVQIPDKGSLNITSNPDPSSLAGRNGFTNVNGNFTVEFWVNPAQYAPDNPTPGDIYSGIDDQPPYAIFPKYGGALGQAGMGVAVGYNGVTVFEHADKYIPEVLDVRRKITTWAHVAVVYQNNVASIYLNGVLAGSNTVPNSYRSVFPSYNIGGSTYGWMPGQLDELRIWNYSRTPAQILDAYSRTLRPDERQGLLGYWPMDNTNGNVFHDVSCAGIDEAFVPNAENWLSSGAPITETNYVEFANRIIVPNHGLPTNYAYNSLNAVVKQNTPDGGSTDFVYDRLGRLTVSQNVEQLQPALVDDKNPAGRYSYTKYDALNRIVEVGEKMGAGVMTEATGRDDNALNGWLASGTNRQVTVTAYDDVPSWASSLGLLQDNLRKRVSGTALLSLGSDATQNRLSGAYYTYDIDGNVSELVQENTPLINSEKQLVTGSNGLKHIRYDYDLISGKVNKVYYQGGKWDQFYYQYKYDDDNRLLTAYSSRYNSMDLTAWTIDANYLYYHHGPLARMELGSHNGVDAVQGVDYAYTLQGWLKGVNGQQLTGYQGSQADMSGDGVTKTPYTYTGRDLLGYSLGYFDNDYAPIGGSAATAFGDHYQVPTDPTQTGQPLYSGNISHATYAIQPLEGLYEGPFTGFVGYTYRYDQLNRMTGMDRHSMYAYFVAPATWNNSNIVPAFAERVSYDGNGNILTYLRNGFNIGLGAAPPIDNLTYNYNRDAAGYLVNNRLRHVNDAATSGGGIDNEPTDNYTYDAIGNLMKDQAQGLQRINWTVYGKMASISKGGTQGLSYGYDPSGNRISKTATGSDGTSATTDYVRDAQGNVLAVYQYKADASGNLTEGDWLEQHLYGSSRLGMLLPRLVIPASQHLGSDAYVGNDQTENLGNRQYELTNHLGNVLVTVNDVLSRVVDIQGQSAVGMANVVSAQDYYPFGMQMPGRTYIAGGSLNYRYGFNGKENDNEVEGVGDQIDYGMRVYDPRIGKFLSVDPLAKKYPMLTPYQYASNTPIQAIDLDGLEKLTVTGGYPNTDANGLPNSLQTFNQLNEYNPKTYHASPESKQVRQKDVINTVFFSQEKCHLDGDFVRAVMRARIADRYSKLDYAHGQVEVPQSRFWSFLSGERTLEKESYINGKVYSANTIIDDNGYLTNRAAPMGGSPSPLLLGGPGELGSIESFTAAEAELFIATEEGAQDLRKVESIKEAIQSGDNFIWSQPIRAVKFEDQMYILDGHHRLKAFTELASKAKVSVQVLSEGEASKIYKDAMEFIRQGAFKTTIKASN